MNEKKNNNSLGQAYFLISAFLITLISIFLLFILNINDNKKKDSERNIKIEKEKNILPSLVLNFDQGEVKFSSIKKEFLKEELVEVEILADSSDKEIVGYDLVISYNPEKLKFIKGESLLDSFKIYSFVEKNYVNLTGIKELNNNFPIKFKNSSLVKLIFTSKVKGETEIALVKKIDKKETFFVDEKTEKIYPKLSTLKIIIK